MVNIPALPRKEMRMSYMMTWWRRLRQNIGAMVGLTLVAIFILVAILSPWIEPYNPLAINLKNSYSAPTNMHPFGTDSIGRDVFSRVIAGARISILVILEVLVLAVTSGTVIGVVAGYRGGVIDEMLMRLTDIFFAFPSFLLAMAIMAALGRSLQNAMISVAIAFWPRYARLIRGLVLTFKHSAYVEAAETIGASDLRIILRHILPNCLPLLLVQASMDAGEALLTTAGLSFVGLGASPPTPEWGVMITEGRLAITTSWWLVIFPGLAIGLTVAGFMYLGDGLRDMLDPTLRHIIK